MYFHIQINHILKINTWPDQLFCIVLSPSSFSSSFLLQRFSDADQEVNLFLVESIQLFQMINSHLLYFLDLKEACQHPSTNYDRRMVVIWSSHGNVSLGSVQPQLNFGKNDPILNSRDASRPEQNHAESKNHHRHRCLETIIYGVRRVSLYWLCFHLRH